LGTWEEPTQPYSRLPADLRPSGDRLARPPRSEVPVDAKTWFEIAARLVVSEGRRLAGLDPAVHSRFQVGLTEALFVLDLGFLALLVGRALLRLRPSNARIPR